MRKTLREIRVANAARQKRWRDKHRLEQPILPVAVQPSTELVYVPIEEVELDEQTRKEYTTRAQQFGKRKALKAAPYHPSRSRR